MENQVNLIAAIGKNNAIGRDNSLPWHISEDLKWFKQHTLGHNIIMGRKTYESIGSKPLPGRKNIVVTRDENVNYQKDGTYVAHTVSDAFGIADKDKSIFVIGGEQIFNYTMPFAHRLYLTAIDETVEDADVFFPYISPTDWREVERIPQQDHSSGYTYAFKIFERSNPDAFQI